MSNLLQKIYLFKEDTPDTIPTSPKCYALKAESVGIQAQQNSEVNNELGAGRGASSKSFGTLNISGDLGMIWNTDNAPILMTHGIGDATTSSDATADSWGATTVTTKGEMVNHSDGLHTLVCYIGGTTDASEPDLASYVTADAGRGTRIVDGTVTWIIMPKLFKQVGSRGECLTSFGIEVEDDNKCGVSSPEYCRYTGLYANSLPFSIAGSTNALKSSVSTIGMSEEDSILVTNAGGTYEAMSAKAGFTETELVSDYFFLEDCVFYLDGIEAPIKTTSFDATINNNISVEDALNKKKIQNVGIVNIEGSFSILMDNTLYAEASNHVAKSAKFVFTKPNGCSMTLEFPQLKLEKTYKEFSTDKSTMLSIPFSAFDTNSVKSVKWETISPISY
jgi:hypothetical protein